MVMRLVRDDDVGQDGSGSQGIAATGTSRPRRRGRSAAQSNPNQHLKMGTEEQLDAIAPTGEEPAGESDPADAQDARGVDADSQEQTNRAVVGLADDDAEQTDASDEPAGAARALNSAALE